MYLEKVEGGLGNGVGMTMGWLWLIGDPANGNIHRTVHENVRMDLAAENHESQSEEQTTAENRGSWWNGCLVGECRIGCILESTLKSDGLI